MTPQMRACLRGQFPIFLMKVFQHLHPGQPPLVMAWYLQAICYQLERATSGEINRLVITVPPRHLKSIAAAVALSSWLLGRDPTIKIMVASYSQDLARQHAEQCRSVMESAWYKELYSTRISDRGNRQLELITTHGGCRKAVSVGGSVTGFGADIIIIDDCMKADEATSQAARENLLGWVTGTLMTRLNSPDDGVIISIQQRLHEDDLPAFLIEIGGYHHLNLLAISEEVTEIPTGPGRVHRREVGELLNPERLSREALDQLRRELGPMVFSAQYQQNPTTPEGNLIQMEWFGSYIGTPRRHDFHRVIQSWDTAATASPTSDWSVCTTWGYRNREWWLLDVYRQRVEYPALKQAVLALEHRWQPDVILIERANTGFSLCQELRAQGKNHIYSPLPREDKEIRLIAQMAELETGKFLLPEEAHWLSGFRSELRAFPNGRHDDQVDSLAQFVKYQKFNSGRINAEYTSSGRPRGTLRRR